MTLTLTRTIYTETYTQGRLAIDGQYFCDTIEDRDRNLTDAMSEEEIAAVKVYGETAIPKGTYKILMTASPKFKERAWARKWDGIVPLVDGVKGFTGIRIHPANRAEELLGCIAPGKKGKGCVTNSTDAWQRLMTHLKGQTDITITIQ